METFPDYEKGNYTAYMVTVERGTEVFVLGDDMADLKRPWADAAEIFATPGANLNDLTEAYGIEGAAAGDFCRWLRTQYKRVWKKREFRFERYNDRS